MNSFYGGKQGSSFIIAQTYTTIAEMVANFGKNNSACPVNFDEYALINTVNKNNPENGQVFRRGYDYNSGRKIISYKHTYGNLTTVTLFIKFKRLNKHLSFHIIVVIAYSFHILVESYS